MVILEQTVYRPTVANNQHKLINNHVYSRSSLMHANTQTRMHARLARTNK